MVCAAAGLGFAVGMDDGTLLLDESFVRLGGKTIVGGSTFLIRAEFTGSEVFFSSSEDAATGAADCLSPGGEFSLFIYWLLSASEDEDAAAEIDGVPD